MRTQQPDALALTALALENLAQGLANTVRALPDIDLTRITRERMTATIAEAEALLLRVNEARQR